jgi:signal transduction histidine kinase
MLQSVRARLTFWYTAVVAIVLIVFSAISYVLLAREIRASTDTSLSDTAHEFAQAVSRDPSVVAGGDVQHGYRYSDREIVLLTRSGTIIASSRARLAEDEQERLADAVGHGLSGFATLPGGEEGDGIRVFAMRLTAAGRPCVFVVARSLDEQADRLENAAQAVLFGIPLALLLAAGGGYLLAKSALRPVTSMSRQARQIGAETLTARIPVENERDELGFLAMTLNDLLERLQRSFESQRRFMADASHELRTPVAIIQGEAEVTLSRQDRSAEEYRESLQVIGNASTKLTRIVQNLFLLARSDAGGYPMQYSRFYLDESVAECVRSMRNIAAVRGVTLIHSTQSDLLIVADEALLQRMVLNLIDNAIKFTPEHGRVEVEVSTEQQMFVIRVRDNGRGIAPMHHEQIFERFFRVDAARGNTDAVETATSRAGFARGNTDSQTSTAAGAGLGLPIARWIAEAHHGSVALETSGADGSVFIARLPSGLDTPASS